MYNYISTVENFQPDIFSQYIEYNNVWEHFIKIIKPGKQIKNLNFFVTQTSDHVIFNLKELNYTPGTGFVDPDIGKAFKHFWINVHTNHLKHIINNKGVHDYRDLGLFSNIMLGVFLTSQKITPFLDPHILEYIQVENQIICNKKILGMLGHQYVNKITTIVDTTFYNNMVEAIRSTSFLKYQKKFNEEMFQKINDNIHGLADNNVLSELNLNNNIAHHVKFFRTILDSANNDLGMLEPKWYKKFYFWNNPVCIYFNPTIIIDDCVNIVTIDTNVLYTDVKTLSKYDLRNYKDLYELTEDMKTKEEMKKILLNTYDFNHKQQICNFFEKKKNIKTWEV